MSITVRRYAEVVAQHPATAEAARAHADRDIAAGRLRFVHFLPRHCHTLHDWAGEYERLLQEQYGVEPWSEMESPYSDHDDNYIFECEYGWRVRAEIERRFGAAVFQKLEAEAKQLFTTKLASRYATNAGEDRATAEGVSTEDRGST